MKLFETIYDKTMQWSKHRFAAFWLSFVSFIEAIFFPIPPDVMLIPMSMAKPQMRLNMQFTLPLLRLPVVLSAILSAYMLPIGCKASSQIGECKQTLIKRNYGLKLGGLR